MIGYVTFGTNDLPRAAAFYDALLAEMDAKRVWDTDRGIGWGVSRGQPTLGLLAPFNGEPAAPGLGLGTHVRALPVDRSRFRTDQQGQRAQQGGLAAAVAADQRQKLARTDGKGQALEHLPAAAAAGQVRYFEEGGRHEASS